MGEHNIYILEWDIIIYRFYKATMKTRLSTILVVLLAAVGLTGCADAATEKSRDRDLVASLESQARNGDGEACIRLADCYREGRGVERDFFAVQQMIGLAAERGAVSGMDEYVEGLPYSDGFKAVFFAVDKTSGNLDELADGVKRLPEVQTMLGLKSIERGDTVAGMKLLREAAGQGCSLAEMRVVADEHKEMGFMAVAAQLSDVADRFPFVYTMLGDVAYAKCGGDRAKKQFAVDLYVKADKRGALNRRGARRVLDFYFDGGDADLDDERDVPRLHCIIGD